MLFLIVLLEGFVTISFEILTIRQLIPSVGNSVVVTSLIIGVFLLFLAYGYRKGGSYERNYSNTLKRNFLLASLGLGLGLSYIFLQSFFTFFNKFPIHSTLLVLTIYLLLIVAPVVYLLGQTVPITLNLWKRNASIGHIGGQVLHVSTIGSFLGATITALVLLSYLGVAWTIFINVFILVFLTLLLADFRKEPWIFLISSFLLIGVFWLNILVEKNLFVTTNNYGNYQIISNESKTVKTLIINNSYSSALDENKRAFPYVEFIKRILFDHLKLTNKNILVLGAGGFTLSAEKTNNNHFDYVDIDARLPQIIKNDFYTSNGQFIADDARHYVNTTDKRYDVVVSDTYSNADTITPHLLTSEHFKAIKKVLTPSGIAIFNIIARPTFEDAYSKRVDATIRSAFGACVSIPMNYSYWPTNLIYICKKSLFEADNSYYTDDLNNSATDFFTADFMIGN